MKPPLLIHAKDNPRLKQVRGLLEQAALRRKTRQTVLEGVHLLDALQRCGGTPHYLCVSNTAIRHPEVTALLVQWPQVDVLLLPDAVYQELRSLGQGVDILAVIEQPQHTLPATWAQDVLILENVQDSGNVGSLLRSAAAAGITQVWCTQGTASVWSPRVLRAGMGAQFSLTIVEHVSTEQALAALRCPVYVTSSHAEHSLYQLDLRPAHAWLMGNEGQGASPIASGCAQRVSIPQPGGQESLNVAVAGAVCLFEAVRQRHTSA